MRVSRHAHRLNSCFAKSTEEITVAAYHIAGLMQVDLTRTLFEKKNNFLCLIKMKIQFDKTMSCCEMKISIFEKTFFAKNLQ